MPNSLIFDLQQQGHLARATRLMGLGHSRLALRVAIESGRAIRPFRGWLATNLASRDALLAVLHRGVLTGSTALRSYGVWAGFDNHVHVLRHPHSKSAPRAMAVPLATFAPTTSLDGIVRHWRHSHVTASPGVDWRASVVDALVDFAKDEPREQFVAALDSALHARVLRPIDLPLVEQHVPLQSRSACRAVDSRAESGTESLARLRLLPLGVQVETQVWIGRHRVDLLVNGWLAIEIDSEEWHGNDRRENSRRTNWLVAQGYRVLHFDYREVVGDWAACEKSIKEQLRIAPGRDPSVPAHRERHAL